VESDVIRVEGLEFAYPVGGFSLRVPALEVRGGESVALAGPSGCGKTTLVNLLAGIQEAAAGVIEVAGLDMATLAPEDRQDLRILKIGLVFQEFELLEYLDVLDNVLLPYRLTPLFDLDAAARERACELLGDLGLGDKHGRFPAQLSQGERQRVALCRALVTQPAVVLGDEPTGNLDPDNRDHVIDALLDYGRDTGAPVVVVTHDHELLPRFHRVIDVSELSSRQGTSRGLEIPGHELPDDGDRRSSGPQMTQIDADRGKEDG
jgi:putative ABC transport system ATP-binding protein